MAAAGVPRGVLATAVVEAVVVGRGAGERECSLFVVDAVGFIPLWEMNAVSKPAACGPGFGTGEMSLLMQSTVVLLMGSHGTMLECLQGPVLPNDWCVSTNNKSIFSHFKAWQVLIALNLCCSKQNHLREPSTEKRFNKP